MKRIKQFFLAVFLFVVVMVWVQSWPNTTTIVDGATPTSASPTVLDPLEVHFIDVGQGDSILIKCGEHSMLIDAGDNSCGTKVQHYLNSQGVTSLDYCINTHPDEDHCGGLDVILYKFPCKQVFLSNYTKDTATYRDVLDTIKAKGCTQTAATCGNSYSLGSATFTILGPVRQAAESNNNSVAILLTHGEKKFLFTGDAELEQEADLLNTGISIDCDVYKAGHHGSRTASSPALLEAASPAFCIISCEENNSYGHPHAEVLNNLRAYGIQVFRTDEQGSIVAYSDGTNITWNCAPSDTWKAGEPTQNSQSLATDTTSLETTSTQPTGTYVCNTNTYKFHIPTCSSVASMAKKNRLDVTCSFEELIQQGYSPCKRCLD